ncbi:hydrogenase maturation protease [soil metagenome]
MLVAGVGNIFLGDDGFGPQVARQLAREPLPEWAKVADFGIRGIHLAYELLDGYETLILVDALPRGEEPGTVSLVERLPDSATGGQPDAHSMDPRTVFAYLESMSGPVPRTLIVGCEPLCTDEEMGLSEPVARAVPEAVRLVHGLLQDEATATPKGIPPVQVVITEGGP